MNNNVSLNGKNLFSRVEKFIFILVAAYLLLDNGILASIVFGFPIGTLGQIVIIPLMIFFLYKGKLKFNLILILVLCWDFYGLIRILLAYENYGLIALRSSTYIADINYILIGSFIAKNTLKRLYFPKILWKLLLVANIYCLMLPLRGFLLKFTPILTAYSGYSVPLLFAYGNTSIISSPFFFSENFFPLNGKNNYSRIIAFFSALFLFTYQAARYNYFIFLILSFYSLLNKPKKISYIFFYIALGMAIISITLFLGIEFSYKGKNIDGLGYFYDHFISSFGISSGSIDGQTSGFSLRTSWWSESLKEVFSSLQNIVFGIGQGRPLTNFYNSDGNIVRDLHNSYIGIFIRDGLIGLTIFLILHIKLFLNIFHNLNLTKNQKNLYNFHQTGLLFIFAILVNSLMQSALEVSYKAIPYYFMWGIIGSYRLKE